jgi:hypothetical protein
VSGTSGGVAKGEERSRGGSIGSGDEKMMVSAVDRIVAATVISWVGLWIHEVHRVPGVLGLTPDGSLPMLLIATGLGVRWVRARSASAATGLAIYGVVNLVGGWISVLPLGWLPFAAEQTAVHYAVHVVYAASQLPLILLAARQAVFLRHRPVRSTDTRALR